MARAAEDGFHCDVIVYEAGQKAHRKQATYLPFGVYALDEEVSSPWTSPKGDYCSLVRKWSP